jgi:hypothetical protein
MGMYWNSMLMYGVVIGQKQGKDQLIAHPESIYNFNNYDSMLEKREKDQGFVEKSQVLDVLNSRLNTMETMIKEDGTNSNAKEEVLKLKKTIMYFTAGVSETLSSIKDTLILKGISTEPQWWFVEKFTSTLDTPISTSFSSLPIK